MSPDELLDSGLGALALDLSPEQRQQVDLYLGNLERWNQRFNLTAVRDRASMVTRHILDSLAVKPFLGTGPVIDVGSGAGLPGIPLAISCPHVAITVLDSSSKRCAFLSQARAALNLSNVDVVRERVETHRKSDGYQQIFSRAFASLDDMITSAAHLLADDGEFVALKGKHPQQELEAIAKRASNIRVDSLQVPGLDEERCLIRFRMVSS